MKTIRPVILADMKGSRGHPLSSPNRPLQFRSLIQDDTPFQDTLERVSAPEFLPPLILTPQSLVEIIEEECDEIAFDYEELLITPEGTCDDSALLQAAQWAQARREVFPLLVCPAHHFVLDQTAFMRAVHDGAQTAEQGYVVSFGVVAQWAETAYDYIEVGTRLHAGYSGHHVLSFVEKPERGQAQSLLDAHRFVWNGGIYCALPETVINRLSSGNEDQSLSAQLFTQDGPVCVVSLLTVWSDLSVWSGLWKALNLQET
ncbi:MAG: hypothetical protein HWE34_13610 [Methylocystaceae bacterium]|nr:hypothetical protein [Methylocystaceae bacterium]